MNAQLEFERRQSKIVFKQTDGEILSLELLGFFFFFFLLKFGIQFCTSSKTTSILLLKNGQISYRYNTC